MTVAEQGAAFAFTAGDDRIFGTAIGETMEGGAGDDEIDGRGGDDVIRGGNGHNYLNGGFGDDLILGGDEGNTVFDYWGNDTIKGGAGVDYVSLSRSGAGAVGTIRVDTLGGDDRFSYGNSNSGQRLAANLGDGNDEVRLSALGGTITLRLGGGQDVLGLGTTALARIGSVTVADFEAGAGGDRIELADALDYSLTNWDDGGNPFASGHLKLSQSGADTLVRVDLDGGGDDFVTVLTIRNVAADALTPFNLGGLAIDASVAPGRTIIGTWDYDDLVGGDGNDRIEALGGSDSLKGMGGDDVLIGDDTSSFMDGGRGDDRLEGGEGDDYMISSSGSDRMRGHDGNDYFYVSRFTGAVGQRIVVDGGAGNDEFGYGAWLRTSAQVDMGGGDDIVELDRVVGSLTIALGSGRDVIRLPRSWDAELDRGTIRVTDFAPRAGGDTLDLSGIAQDGLTGAGANPFGSGHFRLLQRGADTVLQIDQDGGGDDYADAITLAGVAASDMKAANLGGFRPDGAAPAGVTIVADGSGDRVDGGAGDDVLTGTSAYEQMFGNGGSDRLSGGAGFDHLEGGTGDDVLDGGLDGDSIHDGGGSDIVRGGDGDDRITVVRSATDRVETVSVDGGAGNDRLTYFGGGSAALTADMGAGADRVDIASHQGVVKVKLGGGADEVTLSLYSMPVGSTTILDFQAGAGGDRLGWEGTLQRVAPTWNPSRNPYDFGFARLVQDGADTLIQIDPSGRGSTFTTLVRLRGVDAASLTEHNFDHFLPGHVGAQFGTAAADRLAGSDAVDEMDGRAGDDRLIALGGDDRLGGGDGNDLIDGGLGADAMDGGAGNDVYVVRDRGDTIVEAADGGRDSVRAYIDHVLGDTLESLRLYGAAAEGTGNALANAITGNAGNNALFGLDGDDRVAGGGGDDALRGGDGRDTLLGGAGVDALSGENDDDVLSGHDGGDRLYGGGGADRLFGGADYDLLHAGGGDDQLTGGADRDTLVGGAGADRFIFDDGDTGARDRDADTIVDFDRDRGDVLDLSRIDADEALQGDQAFNFIGNAAFSGVAGELHYEVRNSSVYVEADTDGDALADLSIWLFEARPVALEHFVL
jgi:Ca2+-binding RTX toxin-like protein